MKIIHNSRDSRYRSPFGAVTVGSEIAVAIEFEDCVPESVQLHVRKDWESEAKIIRMNECTYSAFTSIAPCLWQKALE